MNIKSRFAVLSIPAVIVGLCWLFPREQPGPSQGNAVAEKEIPVVAFHGRPVREYEEPLPEGARLRIGSTRFRFPFDASDLHSKRAGDYVLVSRHDGIQVMDSRSGRRVDTGSLLEKAGHFAVSPNGKRIVTTSAWDAEWPFAQVWEVDAATETPLRRGVYLQLEFARDSIFNEHFFSADSTELIVKAGRFVGMFDAVTGQRKSLVESQTEIFTVSGDGTRFLTSPNGNPGFFISDASGSYMERRQAFGFKEPRQGELQSEWNGAKSLFARQTPSNFQPYRIVIGDCRTGNQLDSIEIPRAQQSIVAHLALSPQGRFVSYAVEGIVFVWDFERRKEILQIKPSISWKTFGRDQITHSWFSSDGKSFSVHESNGFVRHFELKFGTPVTAEVACSPRPEQWQYGWPDYPMRVKGALRPARSESSMPTGYSQLVMDVAPNDSLIAVGDALGRVDLWRSDGGHEKSLQARGMDISAIAFSAEGKQLAVCDRARQLKIWDCRTWQERLRIQIPADNEDLYPTSLVFSPDGKRLLLSQGSIMGFVDVGTKTMLWDLSGELDRNSNSKPQFTLDGSVIFVQGREPWIDALTGTYHATLPKGVASHFGDKTVFTWGGDRLGRVLSPDGKLIGLSAENGALQVWDLVKNVMLQEFPESQGLSNSPGSLRFSPDGRRLLTFNDRGQLHVWEIASGQLACTLNYPNGHFNDARFGVDGRTIITANHREVIVWDLKPTTTIADPWEALGHDAPVAEQARRTLLADPKHAIAYIEKRMKPAPNLVEARIRRSIDALEHKDFRERERATAELIEYGRGVLPRLQDARLASEEGKARLASLVRLLSAGPTANEMRQVRGEEVLEQARLALR